MPLGRRLDELAPKVARAQEILRERGVADVTDLVAVPSPSPALAAAQTLVHAADIGEPTDLGSGQDHSLNAVHVDVARDVGAAGWRALRRVARATGVNVILERVESESIELEPY